MKKSHLSFLGILFFSFLVIYSCRRDVQNFVKEQSISSGALESAKIWRATHLSALGIKLDAKWNDAWNAHTVIGDVLVVPAPEHPLYDINYTMRRVFLFSLSENQVTKCEIVEFLGYKYDVSNNLDILIKGYYNKNLLENFSGSIYQYDINYTFINSSKYENGVRKLNVKPFIKNMTRVQMLAQVKSYESHLRVNDAVDVVYHPPRDQWPQVGPGCVESWFTDEEYSNDRLTQITYTLESCVCPNQSSGDSNNSSSSNTGNPQNPPYGGGGSSGGGGGDGTSSIWKLPCEEVKRINERYAAIRVLRTALMNDMNSTGTNPLTEYGQVLKAPGNSLLDYSKSTTPTIGTYNPNTQTSGEWTKPANSYTFNPTDGYFYGLAHTHPDDNGASVVDVMQSIINPYFESGSEVHNASATEKDYYTIFAAGLIFTPNYTYTVTLGVDLSNATNYNNSINNLQTYYNSYNTNPATLNTAYRTAAQDYVNLHSGEVDNVNYTQSELTADASVYGLKKALGNAVNIYRSGPNDTKTSPITAGGDSNTASVSTVDCPQ